eukprot:TRINITY_DN19393_c0_g1_i1.p1 TRINITY_DN19393_c0_g1~~TRINITY_DN19393_c0_g1_i1.p1  ORF type:complete len:242 (-),score=1.26 TRINITY_DN19393_c0_g1_i1:279-947(-)
MVCRYTDHDKGDRRHNLNAILHLRKQLRQARREQFLLQKALRLERLKSITLETENAFLQAEMARACRSLTDMEQHLNDIVTDSEARDRLQSWLAEQRATIQACSNVTNGSCLVRDEDLQEFSRDGYDDDFDMRSTSEDVEMWRLRRHAVQTPSKEGLLDLTRLSDQTHRRPLRLTQEQISVLTTTNYLPKQKPGRHSTIVVLMSGSQSRQLCCEAASAVISL